MVMVRERIKVTGSHLCTKRILLKLPMVIKCTVPKPKKTFTKVFKDV